VPYCVLCKMRRVTSPRYRNFLHSERNFCPKDMPARPDSLIDGLSPVTGCNQGCADYEPKEEESGDTSSHCSWDKQRVAVKLSLSCSCRSVRQFDLVGVRLIALVHLSKHLFQPRCLLCCNPLVCRFWVVTDEELLTAAITPERSHLLEACCFFAATLFYRCSPHVLIVD
jgi:hypothetical protein